jgi:hypothetical protein
MLQVFMEGMRDEKDRKSRKKQTDGVSCSVFSVVVSTVLSTSAPLEYCRKQGDSGYHRHYHYAVFHETSPLRFPSLKYLGNNCPFD